ncbi:membrane-bound lytic murein transglycosylase A [Parasphingorhabdus marina DSM 22363]|uniref:peptidoglycan lytic exotransglycosylase n=1 Tax=Parasphingorhabdus marina DSM 22363 TaxID=1123272 RepID=A0A1N6CN72_9SPHN|nr:membrane-bound lytic murein transglycosylase A [Parasphingorhabdus marina DSM 22363]
MTRLAAMAGGLLLLSACSVSIIPEGAQRAPDPPQTSAPQRSEDPPTPAPTAQPPARTPQVPQTAGTIEPVPETATAPDAAKADRAILAGFSAGPDIRSLRIQPIKAGPALQSFRTSCPSLVRRTDNSGLTRGEDWKPACDAARDWSENDAVRFFETQFEAVRIADGRAYATGYFEPQIAGSRERVTGYEVPVYKRPPDLLDVDLGLFSDTLKDKRIRGKIDGTKLVPFADRGEIDDGALEGQGLEIAWAADYIEFFFLQIQGSGRLALPDGSVMRIGYAGQNGRDYTGIGRVMRERGLLADGKTNMQGIVEWLRANPGEGMKIMRENRSYIFFRELTGPGPLGAMGHPVVGRTSVAADRLFVPLGAPVFLDLEHNIADGLWIAQDTGGAIKGANRFDTFWGAGSEAREIAGGMSSRGQALIFLPRGSLARLQAASGTPGN